MSDRPPVTLVGTLRLFADVTRFRKGPEDLPVSPVLLVVCVVVSIGMQALLLGLLPLPYKGNPLAILAMIAVASLVFVALVLNLAKRPERYLQTATAVFGFKLVLLPIAVGIGWLHLVFSEHALWRAPVLMLRIALEIWGLAVMARILNSATGWSVFACVMLTIAWDVLTVLAIISFFPLAATTAAPA